MTQEQDWRPAGDRVNAQDETGVSLLDRPLLANRITGWTLIYIALILFIVLTRFWNLTGRAYDHDESIHAWEAWKLATGQGYIHSPVYHGPFGYHITALVFVLFGDNEFTGRLAAVLFAIGITIMPLFLRKWLGWKGVLITTALMAISPVLMQRSRFFRHDHFAIFFNLVMFIGILRYLDERKTRDLYLVAAALSLGYTTKETTFITYFIYGSFLFGLFLWQWLNDRQRPVTEWPVFDLLLIMVTLSLPLVTPFPVKLLGGDPVDYSRQGIVFSGAILVVLLAIGVAIGLWWDWRRWIICAGIFYACFVPLFTTMFTNGQGFATGMVGSLGYWLSQQGVKRGGQPWFYYIFQMSVYEFLVVGVGIAGSIYYAIRGDHRQIAEAQERGLHAIPFVLFLIYWSWMAFAVYTWAGEKMPWLMMQLVIPLELLGGWTIARLLGGDSATEPVVDWRQVRARGGVWLFLLLPLGLYAFIRLLSSLPSTSTTTEALGASMGWFTTLIVFLILAAIAWRIIRRLARGETWRLVAVSALLVLSAATLRFAWMATYINPDVVTEFMLYAQGTPDTRLVTHELIDMSRRLTGDLSMKVAYDDDSSWPFVWYLRNFKNAQFYGKKPGGPLDAEAVIVGPSNEAGVKPLLGNKYYRRQYRLIWWPYQDWYMNLSLPKLWSDVRDPEARKKLWDVLWNRKYDGLSLTSWPYVHNFALYVRRDVAQQLWDYGPEVVAATGELPGDDYAEKWRETTALAAWGELGSGEGQFRAPKGVATDATGNLYVADSQNHRIQVFDANGVFLRQFGSEGTGAGQFKEPWGVAVAANGNIYVADTWNHRIQVFDPQGQPLFAWGTFGEASGATGPGDVLYGPRDVAIDGEGYVYVTDTGNKRVVKYDANGQMVGAVGGLGDMEGQMQEPVGLAVSPEGNLYVADTWNKRIQVFDSDLNYVRAWSIYGWDGQSVVEKPYLAVDGQGNIYATDPEAYRVVKFDREGNLLAVWGQFGTDLMSMNLPTGIEVDPSGRVIVSDSENGRILLFAGN